MLANFANVTDFRSQKKKISSKFLAQIFEATHSSVRQVPSCFSFTNRGWFSVPPLGGAEFLGIFFVSHFRLPLLLPSAPTDFSGPNLKTSNWINLALPVLKRIHHYIVNLFMLVTHLNQYLMMYVSLPLTGNKYLMSRWRTFCPGSLTASLRSRQQPRTGPAQPPARRTASGTHTAHFMSSQPPFFPYLQVLTRKML